ncbi:MAG: epoxyqueuosine reductase [Sedimentisphaeraceae bacterium JB056]
MENTNKKTSVRKKIEDVIFDLCGSKLNSMHIGDEPAWDKPLIGFSRGDDLLYSEIKKQIGDFYWTPYEAFKIAMPDIEPENLTVVSWVLPQTKATKKDNRKETHFPAKRWAHSRKYGEQFNDTLHDHLVEKLNEMGISAVAPSHLPQWSMKMSENFGISSNWSHRHAAYIAGLGTFGLCDGLITEYGKAMRCGSIVVDIQLEPTERPYDNPHAYCLYYAKGACQACIKRCPVGAITEEGHDKEICRQYVFETTSKFVKEEFGIEAYGCGFCQTAVPCESSIPPACRPVK